MPKQATSYTAAILQLQATLTADRPKVVDVAMFCAKYGVAPTFFDALRDLDCIVLAPIGADELTRFTRTNDLLTITSEKVAAMEQQLQTGKKKLVWQENPAIVGSNGEKPPIGSVLDRALATAEVPDNVLITERVASACGVCEDPTCGQVLPPPAPKRAQTADEVVNFCVAVILANCDGDVAAMMLRVNEVKARLKAQVITAVADLNREIEQLQAKRDDLHKLSQ